MSLLFADEAALRAFGARLAARLRAGDVITLSGDLGAGKTTLARGILEGLGAAGGYPEPQLHHRPELRAAGIVAAGLACRSLPAE